MIVTTAVMVLLGYLSGSIPSGVVLARRKGVDIRQSGSGNIGATNVARTAGLGAGLLTLIFDVAKGLIPTLAASHLIHETWAVSLVGLAAFLGHIFPIFLRFAGGKGVATTLGVFLVLAPAAAALSAIAFGIVAVMTRYVSLASLVAVVLLPLACFWLGYNISTRAVAIIAAVIVVLRHRANIRRLWRREEPTFDTARTQN